MTDFRVRRWAAWAPGLQTQEAWSAWAAVPSWPLPGGEALAPLTELPAMTRRRIDPLGRAALQAAWWAQGAAPTGPVVFASRWGEISRAVSLLQQLSGEEALSPTTFSHSVHNAMGAAYSIARGDTASYSAVSSGESSAAAGVCEAVGWLAAGAAQVLVVSAEAELPEPYRAFEKHPGPLRAWAVLLEKAERGLRLQSLPPSSAGKGEAELPPDLAALRFLLGADTQLQQSGWLWSRHG